jgi:FixJ family two-component response regulator
MVPSPNPETIHIVDDEASFRTSLARMLRARGFTVRVHDSAASFFESVDVASPGCAILDCKMPGCSGLEVQDRLVQAGDGWQVIFLTGRADVPQSVQAMKHGAVDFLLKPALPATLVEAVKRAVERLAALRVRREELSEIARRVEALTPREGQVLSHVIAGRLNKQIADQLGTAEKTVKIQRAQVMRKMGVQSVAELVRVTEKLGIKPA